MTTFTTWQYHLLFLSESRDTRQVQQAMDDLGRQGWEFVAVTDAGEDHKIFIFKRPAS